MSSIYQDFLTDRLAPWRPYLVGSSALEQTGSTIRLVTSDVSRRRYTDAQLDDAYGLSRRRYAWMPPLRMSIRARFSHGEDALQGTAGFGFWNYPSPASGNPWPALPRAIWFFFASPPSNLKLDTHTPGAGCWKVATIDTWRPDAIQLLPVALPAAALMNVPALYRAFWPHIQRAVGIGEAPVNVDMTDWHIYTIDWGITSAHFSVDGRPVLRHAPAPGGPLCFVAWLDNQYAVVTPWGRFGWGLLDIPGRQWLEVDWLAIERNTHG
jgi:hypothetical protein